MADTPAKRQREAKKRRMAEMKAQRKAMRKQGLLGQDNAGFFAPGEPPREVVNEAGAMGTGNPPPPPPPQDEPEEPAPQ